MGKSKATFFLSTNRFDDAKTPQTRACRGSRPYRFRPAAAERHLARCQVDDDVVDAAAAELQFVREAVDIAPCRSS